MTLLDVSTLSDILLVAALGGLIGLDRTAAGQFMVSQPIVAGPLIGWVLGDLSTGLVIGAVLELIWVLDLPVGSFVPADSTVASIAATAIAVLGSGKSGAPAAVIGFCLLLTTAMAPLTMAADRFIRVRNARLAAWAADLPEHGGAARIGLAQTAGLIVFFLKAFVLLAVLVPAGLAAVTLFNALPDRVHAAMGFYAKLLPLLGAAAIIRKLSIDPVDRYVLFGFVAALLSSLLFRFHPAVAVPVAAVTGWLGVRFRG